MAGFYNWKPPFNVGGRGFEGNPNGYQGNHVFGGPQIGGGLPPYTPGVSNSYSPQIGGGLPPFNPGHQPQFGNGFSAYNNGGRGFEGNPYMQGGSGMPQTPNMAQNLGGNILSSSLSRPTNLPSVPQYLQGQPPGGRGRGPGFGGGM